MKEKKNAGEPGGEALSEALRQLIGDRLRSVSDDGRIPCAKAFSIARELEVPIREVGRVADALDIRIMNCQLGCF